MLKGVVQTMEEDLLKEKNRHQRSAAKSQQEIRRLKEQVDELKNAEGDLKVQRGGLRRFLRGHLFSSL